LKSVKHRIRSALSDRRLGEAVLRGCERSTLMRDRVVGELPDFEAARLTAREVREQSLEKLDLLLDRFCANFTAAGGAVHHAEDASSVCSLVLDILRRRDARRGVKSKSMVAEEVGLGKALVAAGVDAVESDLGEFIVQLAGEPPSHITAPALHLSREDIGRVFARELDIPYTDDPQALAQAARRVLRRRFIEAEFGISGANFLIAETGHLVVVENEGNARLGMSVPPLYIAITGLEKVISALDDLPPLLNLLPRSATGQRLTTYVHMLHPSRSGEDGPEEMHIILVDNGRRRTLIDPVLREMLLCIRCGACLNVCPVYRSVGGHAYGSVYPGPMGAVLSNLLGSRPMAHPELPHLSTLCGVCREVCPVGIDLPRLLLELRARGPKSTGERLFASGWGWVMSSSPRFETAGRLARLVGRVLPGGLPGGWLKGGGAAFRDAAK